MTEIKEFTICLLMRNDEVLLAMKKRGFGTGKWNGAGGKKVAEETIEHTAIRETWEEIHVTPKELDNAGVINFHFPDKETKNQITHLVTVFRCHDWDGEPSESEEMQPAWFRTNQLPFNEMFEADKVWLPLILEGKNLNAEFNYDVNFKLIGSSLHLI